MIQHSSSSIFKALLGIGGVLAFFLIVMHQASQLFR
jgi:hypothetical protein